MIIGLGGEACDRPRGRLEGLWVCGYVGVRVCVWSIGGGFIAGMLVSWALGVSREVDVLRDVGEAWWVWRARQEGGES